VFVGVKMVWLNQAFGGKLPIEWSLGVIGAILNAKPMCAVSGSQML
jgi:tellurite resistance protein TerC